MDIYKKFRKLKVDKTYINLEEGSSTGDYFCTPIGARVIGWENGIHYCFIDGFNEMVFAVNPDGSVNDNGEDLSVYPLAESFEIFLRLILAGNCANHIEQIINFTKEEFDNFLKADASDDEDFRCKQQTALDAIRNELSLTPLDNPYEYVKALQKEFDYQSIQYTNEYYDTLGLEQPNGSTSDTKTEVCTASFFFEK